MIKKIVLLCMICMIVLLPVVSVYAEEASGSNVTIDGTPNDDGSFSFQVSSKDAGIRAFVVTYSVTGTGYNHIEESKVYNLIKNSGDTKYNTEFKVSPPREGKYVKLMIMDSSLKSVLRFQKVFGAMVYPYISNILTEPNGYTLTDTGVDGGYSYSEYDISVVPMEGDTDFSALRLLTLNK